MTNLSGKKRQQMLEFLEKYKKGLSDETSLSTVRDIEEELTTRKYGLVWEKHEERIDQEMQTKFLFLLRLKSEGSVWPGGRTDTITFWREIICTA